MAILNRGCLSGVNDMGKVMFNSINKSFGDNFMADIAEADGAEIFGSEWSSFLGNKGN